MTPLVDKINAGSGADVIFLHMVSHPMALIVKQARALGVDIPIVTSSSMVAPTATALVETCRSRRRLRRDPVGTRSGRHADKIEEWADRYRKRGSASSPTVLPWPNTTAWRWRFTSCDQEQRHDRRRRCGRRSPAATYEGVAKTYKSNGHGDMAHDADVVCYDGSSRIPTVARHYSPDELMMK